MGSKRLLPACTLVLFLFSGMALADKHGMTNITTATMTIFDI
jgi:hypothetical protein